MAGKLASLVGRLEVGSGAACRSDLALLVAPAPVRGGVAVVPDGDWLCRHRGHRHFPPKPLSASLLED